MTDSERLEALIEEWRENARMAAEPGHRETFLARCETFATCAGELEEAIATGDEDDGGTATDQNGGR